MTTQISSKVLGALGVTLKEDSWSGSTNGVLDDASVDTVVYNGKTYSFSTDDLYSDDLLEKKLERILGGDIDIVSDTSSDGWGTTLKYLIFNDSWNAKTVLVDANGKALTTKVPSAPAPKKPDSGSGSDNY